MGEKRRLTHNEISIDLRGGGDISDKGYRLLKLVLVLPIATASVEREVLFSNENCEDRPVMNLSMIASYGSWNKDFCLPFQMMTFLWAFTRWMWP